MNTQNDQFRLYFARIRPIYNELFSMAHIICGNYEQAEFALSTAIYSGWANRRNFRSSRAFLESMRADMRRIALAQAKPDAEITWEMRPMGDEEDEHRLISFHDDPVILRAVMLRYGCGLSVKDVARLAGHTRRQTDKMLRRFINRVGKKTGASKPEAYLSEMCMTEMLTASGAPDIGAMFRTFEAEAERYDKPSARRAKRVVSAVCCVLAFIILACAIWLTSALIRPARIAEEGLLTETLNEQ